MTFEGAEIERVGVHFREGLLSKGLTLERTSFREDLHDVI